MLRGNEYLMQTDSCHVTVRWNFVRRHIAEVCGGGGDATFPPRFNVVSPSVRQLRPISCLCTTMTLNSDLLVWPKTALLITFCHGDVPNFNNL